MIRKLSGGALVGALIVGFLACAGLEPLPEGVDGVWKARRPGGHEQVRLDLYRGPAGHRETQRTRFWLDLDDVEGFDATAFEASEEPLAFQFERDAGALVFEGSRQRRPEGTFRFEPSADFLARLEQLGLTAVAREQLLKFGMYGVSMESLDALIAAGVTGHDADDLFRIHRYDLSPDWIASVSRLAGPPDFDDLITLRYRGVGTRHVDRWLAAGIGDLPVDDLLRLHRHGLDGTEIAAYRAYGFEDVDAWLAFFRNGIPDELIGASVEAGVEGTGVDEIVRLFVHGVGASDVRDARGLIEAGFDWDALIYLWRRGIETPYAERLVESDWAELDKESIAQLAASGIETDWALRVRAAGGNLDIDDLLTLRRYGVRAADYERFAQAGLGDVESVYVLFTSGIEPGWIDRMGGYFKGDLDAQELADLRSSGVNEEMMRRLAEAGFEDLDVDEAIAARRQGVDDWIERRR